MNSTSEIERRKEAAIDALRLKAFETNSDADRQAYFDAVSKWFQDRHIRRVNAERVPFLSVQGAVKKLAWGPVSENGNDIQSFSTLGKYVISIDDAPAGGTHYLWIAGQSDSSDYHSSYQNMFEAKAAAQADYEARILSALEAAPPLSKLKAENARLKAQLSEARRALEQAEQQKATMEAGR